MSAIRNLPGIPNGPWDSLSFVRKLLKALANFTPQEIRKIAVEPGFVMPWPDTAVKDDSWYFLEGQVLSRETDLGLFRVYGTGFNTGGEGTNEFRLPAPAAPYTGHKWMVKR